MSRMTNRLRNRLELWGLVDVKNALGEDDKQEQKLKDIWCNIIPQHGASKEYLDTSVEYIETPQTIIVRKKSLTPQIDMFFKDDKGKRFNIIDFFEDYKNKEFWEFRTKIVYE